MVHGTCFPEITLLPPYSPIPVEIVEVVRGTMGERQITKISNFSVYLDILMV